MRSHSWRYLQTRSPWSPLASMYVPSVNVTRKSATLTLRRSPGSGPFAGAATGTFTAFGVGLRGKDDLTGHDYSCEAKSCSVGSGASVGSTSTCRGPEKNFAMLLQGR